jgi:hypothetical protein
MDSDSPWPAAWLAAQTELRGFIEITDSRAPLYARLAAGLADAAEAVSLLAAAPQPARIPVTLFAAIHDLLLADPREPLAAWYPNLTDEPRRDDPVPAARELCRRRRDDLLALVTTRVPQTNELGRSAMLLLALAALGEEQGPLALLDAGASAGINLIPDRLRVDYDGHRVGAGPLALSCGVRGEASSARLPSSMPVVADRRGVDLRPVDLEDPEQVRWLEACVWPDQTDRFDRLRLAVDEVRRTGVVVQRGDVVADLPGALARLQSGHPVVTTSWVLNYLGEDGQRAFSAMIDHLGRARDLTLVNYEEPDLTPGLDWPAELAAESLSVLRVVRWRDGQRRVEHLAAGHPHGYWFSWLN